ncbi:MAG: site-specific integrase, partial [Selenomonadaceae bacterium]|nr:site-specific integrase [Selenomonadaceae bacterium]
VVEKGGFPTKKEAYEAGVTAFADWKHGNIGITSERITVKEYLAKWLEHMKHNNALSTIEVYTRRIKRINQHLGSIILQELKARDVDNMLSVMYKDGLSYNTINSYKGTLHCALQYAVYPAELIVANPAQSLRVPKSAPRRVVDRQVISAEAIKQMLEQYPFGHPYHVPVVLAYYTGMRIGEILGLTWDKIDLEKGVIKVRQQLKHLCNLGDLITKPKTPSSSRDLLIDTEVISMLKEWRLRQSRNEMRLGASYVYVLLEDNQVLQSVSKGLLDRNAESVIQMVCTREDGRYVSYGAGVKAMTRLGTNAHSFRHTHATALTEGGATLRAVASRLGQKDINITANVYTHVTEEMQQEALNIVEAMHRKTQTNEKCRQNADEMTINPL